MGNITIISHSKRNKLGLSIIEYCVLDAINRGKVDNESIIKHLKIHDDYKNSLESLILKMIDENKIIVQNGKYKIYKEWETSAANFVKEFNEFWTKDGKVCWPGSKKDAYNKYTATRIFYEHEYLISKRDEYFEFLALKENEYRKKMQASVFLNISNEKFNQDFMKNKEENKTVERSKLDSEEYNSLFE